MEYVNFDILTNQPVEQVLQSLSMNLRQHKAGLLEAEAAYNGNTQGKGYETGQFTKAFRRLGHFSDNWLQMIVEAFVDRLLIQGFRVGDSDNTDSDKTAYKIWQANHLDQASTLAHREAMKFGNAYIMVDPTTTVKGMPRVTVETPFQVAVYQDPSDRYSNVAALKTWQAADGYIYCNLFTSKAVLKFQSPTSYYDWQESGLIQQLPIPETIPWVQYDEIAHDLGRCPVISIENQPTLTRGGVSDLEVLIPLQMAIDNLVKHMLIASEYAAWPQKYALNIEVPKDVNGNPMNNEAVEASLSRFWGFPPPEKGNPEVKVGAFPSADLQNYTVAIEEVIHNMAMISSVPAYRLMGRLANLSASAILAAEAGFIDKCRTKQSDYSVGWEQVMGLALRAAGDENYDETISTIWKDPSAVSGANLAASLVALQSVGIPQPELWSIFGASPQEIERWTQYNIDHPPVDATPSPQVDQAVHALTAHNAPNTNPNTPDGMDTAASDSRPGE